MPPSPATEEEVIEMILRVVDEGEIEGYPRSMVEVEAIAHSRLGLSKTTCEEVYKILMEMVE